jgi:hypothetical protein
MEHTTDSKVNFRYLFHDKIEAAVKVSKNSNRLTGCLHPRKIIVLQQLKNFEKWKARVNYGSISTNINSQTLSPGIWLYSN